MKNNDFQAPSSKLSFCSVFGGLMSAVLIIVGLEFWAGRLNQTAKTEPAAAQLVFQSAPLTPSQP